MPRRRIAAHARILVLTLVLVIAAPLGAVSAASGVVVGVPGGATLAPLDAGDQAVVRASGSCLNLRATPGLDGERVDCLPEGTVVTVLGSATEADGHRWLEVQWGSRTGWAAEEFLQPYSGPATGGGSCTQGADGGVRPGFNGGLHTGGGVSMAAWGGGTVHGMQTRAAAEGCDMRSVWVSADGRMVGYVAGAPDFVNEDFLGLFPGGYVPSGQLVIIDCVVRGSIAAASVETMTPAASAPAPQRVGSAEPPSIKARAAVVIDGASGEVLFEQDAYEPLAPASITKIITAILAIEGSDSDHWVPSDVDGRQMPGSSLMGLRTGDCFTMRDLLYGLMLPSGNDAALAIGRYVSGSDEAFVHMMNTLVERLGLTGSHFTDPHGLGSSDHRMSAYDIAMASRYGMTLPAFREIVAASRYTAVGSREVTMFNVNGFLDAYPDSDGVKTGYTRQAGRTLAASAERDGRRLYAVVLNTEDRNGDASALLDWAYENFSWE